tara:strand:- start:986 stop:1519 length:534 start_codon:yes stop_codon:yes gene_type:complete
MLKRPLEDKDNSTSVSKKQRCGDKLDSMKATIEKLLLKASEEHEQSRIAAIDNMHEMETQWETSRKVKEQYSEELKAIKLEYDTAHDYVDKFEQNSTLKMLNKASDCNLDAVKTLSKHREQIESTLQQLKLLRDTLETQRNTLVSTVETSTIQCEKDYQEFKEAENKVEIITELIEN